MSRKRLLSSLFAVAGGLAIQSGPAQAQWRPLCELTSQPYFEYGILDVPQEDVLTAKKYISHFPDHRMILTQGKPRRMERFKVKGRCDAMARYQFYLKTEEVEKLRGEPFLHLSTDLNYKQPGKTRQCLTVPVSYVRMARDKKDPATSVLSFYIDETYRMTSKRGGFYLKDPRTGGSSNVWCHTIKVWNWDYLTASVPTNLGPK